MYQVSIDGKTLATIIANDYEHALQICKSTYENKWIKVSDLTITKL